MPVTNLGWFSQQGADNQRWPAITDICAKFLQIVMTMKEQSKKQWQQIGTNQVIFDVKCDDDQICHIA